MSKLRNLIVAMALLATPLALTAIEAAPASAASTYVYNIRGSYVPLCGSPGCPYGPNYMIRNGNPSVLYCWVDSSWHYGNYWTNRWFRAYFVSANLVAYVPASYVINQYAVPHC